MIRLTISMRHRIYREHFGCSRFVAGFMAFGEWVRFGEPMVPSPSILKEQTK